MPVSRNPEQQRGRAQVNRAGNRNASSSSLAVPTSSLAGQVVWICPSEEAKDSTQLPVGCYNHPAVILSPCQLNEQVVILIMTSFNGTDLVDKHPNAARARARYLPIHPSSHPDTTDVLRLRDGMTLRKNSYLNISVQHTVRFEILRPYDRTRPTDYYLGVKSYQKLVRLPGFEAIAAQAQTHLAAQIAPQHRRLGLSSFQHRTEPQTPARPSYPRREPTLPSQVPARPGPGTGDGLGGMTLLGMFNYCAEVVRGVWSLGWSR
ncbi:hypothetical protein B0T18DRAFT_405476 [Schizothecium vesticola]|uniref:Uncharacterized protein n=1 Tax=Schizothecium vesticola TaxID=314040 RepID=A0AA40F0N4_9PEZI|nr:hypothetical protein B0T18DRAFT_405476 [Schizothecium vesticola]